MRLKIAARDKLHRVRAKLRIIPETALKAAAIHTIAQSPSVIRVRRDHAKPPLYIV